MKLISRLPSLMACVALVVECSLLAGGLFLGQSLRAEGSEGAGMNGLLRMHCEECHGGKKTKGGLDVRALVARSDFFGDFEVWGKVLEVMRSGEMPPEEGKAFRDEDRSVLLRWIEGGRKQAIERNAGDPGPVTLRRLTNAEYERTLRDLTGVRFDVTGEFIPDGGGGEGFTNIGDALFLTPAQLERYIGAARRVADHASILPGSGVQFSAEKVGLRGPDQWKSTVERSLYVWYQKVATPHVPKDEDDLREADYMEACWKFRHKESTGAADLESLAKEYGVNPAFLSNWWNMLQTVEPRSRYLDLTRVAWRELPGPEPERRGQVPTVVRRRLEEIQRQRRSWFERSRGGWAGVQRMQQDSDGIRRYPVSAEIAGKDRLFLVVGDTGDGNRGDVVSFQDMELTMKGGGKVGYAEWLRRITEDARIAMEASRNLGGDVAHAERHHTRLAKALALFGKHPFGKEMGPDAFGIQAPLSVELPVPTDGVRLKVAGLLNLDGPEIDHATVQWTLVDENPPQPDAVIPGVLTVWKRGSTGQKTAAQEFEVMKRAFPDSFERRLEEIARNYHLRPNPIGVYYFSNAQLEPLLTEGERHWLRESLANWQFVWNTKPHRALVEDWDKAVMAHLERFVARAFRRPVSSEDRERMNLVYQEGISKELDRESAAREVIVKALISPEFLFRMEASEAVSGVVPVSGAQLATRLSYFLWSTMPDEVLTELASSGRLVEPEILRREVRRMLSDKRSEAFAEEFMGQWFEFREMEAFTKIDSEKFPMFTSALRSDLKREAVLFFSDLVQRNRPVREVLSSTHSFLNERLAQHYGVVGVSGSEFRRVEFGSSGRGGVLGMGAMLVRTSYPQRTSPVLRGNWILHNVLGTPVPPPPANVPTLDESAGNPASLRERLARHRQDKACSVCHDRIDPLGFALEGFDPLGRFREKDEAGMSLDVMAETRDGRRFSGVAGLRGYLLGREDEFYRLFGRKLIGYALGRKVVPSDEPLIEEIAGRLRGGVGTFGDAVELVVASRQFLNRRND
jgi:hypothetical protein